jgi:hypothetical protein
MNKALDNPLPQICPVTHNEAEFAYLVVELGVANMDTTDLLHNVVLVVADVLDHVPMV